MQDLARPWQDRSMDDPNRRLGGYACLRGGRAQLLSGWLLQTSIQGAPWP